MKTKEFDIAGMLFLLLRKVYILIIGCIAGLLVAYSVTSFLIVPKYTSSLNMYVNNGYTAQDGTGVITTGTINASISLVNTYSVLLKDDTFMQSVSEALGGRVSARQIQSVVTMNAVNETEVMRISATTTDPVLSADICNTIAALAPDMLKRVTQSGAVEVVGPATPAARPSSPNLTFNLLVGALIGILLPAAGIVLRALFDTTITSEEEVKQVYGLTSLGEVPSFRMDSAAKKQLYKNKGHRSAETYSAMRLSEKTPFQIREAYKAIRTNLIFALGTSDKKIIEISSSSPEEYKSTTTANLAIAMSQTGAKVLLIDADMRKPVQHKIFRQDNSKGLSKVLAGLEELGDCIKQNVLPNLDVFTAGPTPPNPSELLGSKNMEVLLDALEKYYDIIFIDTPPVNIVTDALSMSKYTSGVLLLVRQGKTQYRDIEESVEAVRTTNTNLLGTIFVDTNEDKRRYGRRYGHGYKYGYGYYGREDEYASAAAREETDENRKTRA